MSGKVITTSVVNGVWVGILCLILLQEQLQKQKKKENFPDNQEEFANKSS